ncbi:MAG: methyltransferase domain-containing protein [Lachnospiraceae bacterium]|nr:methyltransferase domain-containing protein [Lachnospiraceae bacterium]
MNTIWSTYIQNIGTLYDSRSLRFCDLFRDEYKKIFALEDKHKILEIGCGPGALAESLARWYPSSQIFGLDRDSNFIQFAANQAPHIQFSEGDATSLPYESESFDVTISNTVAEHIEPSAFYGEQYRVLRKNGVCLVLSARKGIQLAAPCIAEESDFERDIWQRTAPRLSENIKKHAVCAYPQNESELPLHMEQYGFRNVKTEYITVNLTPDNPIYSPEMAYAMINANRQGDIDSAQSLKHIAADLVTPDEVEELIRRIHVKYDKRLALYDAGIRQWDTNLSVTMIVRGTK